MGCQVAILFLVYTPLAYVRASVYNSGMSLAHIRKSKNLSLGMVAAKMGITRSGVQRIEDAENPLLSTLTRYAEAIGEEPLTIINTVIEMSKKSVQSA